MIIAALDISVQVALVAAGGVAAGSFIAAIFGCITAYTTRKTEERRIIYDIAGKLAAEQWKLDVERTDAFNATLKDGGIFRTRSSLSDFQVPIPHVAQTVRRIVDELDASRRPKTCWIRLRDWYAARRATRQKAAAKKKKEAEQAVAPNGP
jgi:hypothetical protein